MPCILILTFSLTFLFLKKKTPQLNPCIKDKFLFHFSSYYLIILEYYLDLAEYLKNYAVFGTYFKQAIPHFWALECRMQRFHTELLGGVENEFHYKVKTQV